MAEWASSQPLYVQIFLGLFLFFIVLPLVLTLVALIVGSVIVTGARVGEEVDKLSAYFARNGSKLLQLATVAALLVLLGLGAQEFGALVAFWFVSIFALSPAQFVPLSAWTTLVLLCLFVTTAGVIAYLFWRKIWPRIRSVRAKL